MGWLSIGAGLVQLVCLPVFLVMYSNGDNGQGAVEIIDATAGAAWIAVVSLNVLRSRPPTARRPEGIRVLEGVEPGLRGA